jgi:hypothetical protein
MLGRGQSLCFLATEEVRASMLKACTYSSGSDPRYLQEPCEGWQGLTSWHVLMWVVANSRAAMQQGVLEWASKGMHFAGRHVCGLQ